MIQKHLCYKYIYTPNNKMTNKRLDVRRPGKRKHGKYFSRKEDSIERESIFVREDRMNKGE